MGVSKYTDLDHGDQEGGRKKEKESERQCEGEKVWA
jgi:hypothetical protein